MESRANILRSSLRSASTPERPLASLKLLPGQIASIAGSPTQAGWDLQISDRDGELLERIQLKATEDMGYIKDALERYPDIRIAAPAEIDGNG